METVASTVFLLVTVSAELHVGKYVFIQDDLPWKEATKHCKRHFIALSPITSLSEEERLKNVTAGMITGRFWTGLYWNRTHWKWSGRLADYIPPSVANWSHSKSSFASLCFESCQSKRWEIEDKTSKLPFLCINLILVEKKKSWEEALESCRKKNLSLTSLASSTELLLAKRKIQQKHITERVWIGLRFLRNRWMWMNMDPLEHQAWSEGSEDHQCPAEARCGALNKDGLWENRDCEEELNFICS